MLPVYKLISCLSDAVMRRTEYSADTEGKIQDIMIP
jgi:hypothetical protein